MAEAIVRDEPTLANDLAASNREALRYRVRSRFKGRIQLGILRRLEGRYRLLPEVLPERRSEYDRIFPDWNTLSWILVPGAPAPQGWWPTRKWLTKKIIGAMLGVRESTIDVYMRKGFLNRIRASDAPVENEACFWTAEVMTWPRMQKRMRDYEPPPPDRDGD